MTFERGHDPLSNDNGKSQASTSSAPAGDCQRVTLQALPPDLLITIFSHVPAEACAVAASMCRAFSQATARIHPTHVTVPPGVLPLTGSSDTEWERWASFVTWILRERATLTHFTVHVSFTQAHQVEALFRFVTQVCGICKCVERAGGGIALHVHLGGSHKSTILPVLLPAIKRAPACSLHSLTSDRLPWSRNTVSANDVLLLPHLRVLTCGIGRSVKLSFSQQISQPEPPLREASLSFKVSHFTDALTSTLALCTNLEALELQCVDDDEAEWNASLPFAAMLTSLHSLRSLTVAQSAQMQATATAFSGRLCATLSIVLPRLRTLRTLDLRLPCNADMLANLALCTDLTLASVSIVLNGTVDCIPLLWRIPACRAITSLALHATMPTDAASMALVLPALTQLRTLNVHLTTYPRLAAGNWLVHLSVLTALTALSVHVEEGYESDEDEDEDGVELGTHGCTGPLCEALRALTGLCHLELSASGEAAESARWAMAAASCLTRLSHLSLDGWCGQPDDCFWALELATSLPLLTELASLKLTAMPELNSAASVEGLAPAICSLTRLRTLDLQGTTIPAAGQKAVEDALAGNTSLSFASEFLTCAKGVAVP